MTNDSQFKPVTHVRGMALVIALLLLLVLTILGVASMSNVVMQERMAGNVNLQTWAFEAASAGVTATLQFAEPVNWGVDSSGDPRMCTRGGGEWIAEPLDFIEITIPNLPNGLRVGYTQRLGCFEPENQPEEWADFDEVPLQLLVLNRGEVRRGTTEVLARREVEVRVDRRGEADCLLTLGKLDLGGIDMGNSKQGIVDGGPGGCPIRTSDPATAAEMRRQLIGNGGNSLIGNYQPNPPGIHAAPLRGIWGNAENLARATNAVKIGVRAYNAWETQGIGAVDCDALPPGLNCDNLPPGWAPQPNPFMSCRGTLYTGNVTTAPADPWAINYITGNLDVGGGSIVRGMNFVERGMLFNGNATYRGDLIILGGLLDVRGFGNAGNTGSLHLHSLIDRKNNNSVNPAYDPDDVDFGYSQAFNVSGMGKASITADDCTDLEQRWDNVNTCLADLESMTETGEFALYKELIDSGWSQPDLDIPDFGDEDDDIRFPEPRCGLNANPRNVIASWREYIDRERWN
jgi:hypothetical protein